MNKKILIVEDHPAVLRVLTLSLRQRGYDVLEANTGGLGLALTSSANPDLVLLDLSLPDLSGLEIAKKINKILRPLTYLWLRFRAVASESWQ